MLTAPLSFRLADSAQSVFVDCEHCVKVEEDLYKLYRRIEGVDTIEFAEMDYDRHLEHAAVKQISHGNYLLSCERALL